jgi:hypothetical protein
MAPEKHDSLTRYWPFGVGGLVGPILAVFVSRWVPFHFAVGASMFVGFAAAVWVFQRGSARLPRGFGRSLTASLVSGLAAGLVAGVLAFLFPWR